MTKRQMRIERDRTRKAGYDAVELHEFALRECRPNTQASRYPGEFLELANELNPFVVTHTPTDCPHHEKARRIMARGIPYQELGDHYTEQPIRG